MGDTGHNDGFISRLKVCYEKLDRLYLFFVLFAVVLLIESIGATYIISTMQAIERQFQIPSKLSGLMVSASDFAYIPTVIFVSYFGSKGNRAKWIGAGTLITALSHLIISSSNFVFPVEHSAVNLSALVDGLVPSEALLAPNVTLAELLDYEPIRDRLSNTLREEFLKKVAMDSSETKQSRVMFPEWSERSDFNDSYTLNGRLLVEIVDGMRKVVGGDPGSSADEVKSLLEEYVHKRAEETVTDFLIIESSARAPFAFCSELINNLRQMIREAKCLDESFHEEPFIMLFMGLIGFGIGRTMPWSLGIPMIDDNVANKNLPAFFAGINFVRILGPVCGFLIGSFCSSFYYTLRTPPGLTPGDPTWIGAWWLGYLFIGLLLIGPSSALYLFPVRSKSMKASHSMSTAVNTNEQNEKRVLSIFDKYQENDKKLSIGGKFKEFRKAYTEILKSKVFIGILAARVVDMFAFRGYMVFLPKYLENQFGLPQYNVHILMASFGVFGFALGTISGGLITRRFKLNGRSAATFVLLVSLLNTIIFFSKAFIGCYSIVNTVGANGFLTRNPPEVLCFAGFYDVSNAAVFSATHYNYTQSCNANCGCQSAPLFPVCDKSGYTFFSPCHAGCRDVEVVDVKKYELQFSSCECRPGEILTKRNCHDDCRFKTILFFSVVMISAFAAGNCLVPAMLLLLRSVPREHRSIALGLQGFMVSLLASLPSPLIWGAIVDTTCLVWSHACPGAKGSCAIYEPVKLRHRLHFTYVGLRIVSAIADFYVVTQARGVNITDDETDDNSTRNHITMNSLHLETDRR